MKLNLLVVLFLLSLLSITFAANLLRTEKKNKKIQKKAGLKTRDNSYSTGFDCSIEVSSGKEDNFIKGGEGIMRPTQLENPTDANNKIYWVWELKQAPTGNLKKIMTNINGNKWGIAWRHITSTFTYTNPWADNKYTRGFVTNDDGEIFHLRVKYPYKMFGWYINDEEGQKICNTISARKTENQNSIKQTKSGLSTASATYLSNKPLFDAASKDASSLKQQVDKLTSDKNTIESTLKTKKDQLLLLNSQLESAQRDASKKETELADLNTKLNSLNSQHQGTEAQLKELGSSSTMNAEATEKIKKETDDSLNKFNTEIESVKKEAPQRVTEISQAIAENTKLNLSGVSLNLGKIFPN